MAGDAKGRLTRCIPHRFCRTFTQISEEIGLTNAYTAQLFYNQVNAEIYYELKF